MPKVPVQRDTPEKLPTPKVRSGAESRAAGAERLRRLEAGKVADRRVMAELGAENAALAQRLAALEARKPELEPRRRPDPVTMAEHANRVRQRNYDSSRGLDLDSGLSTGAQFNRNSVSFGPPDAESQPLNNGSQQVGPGSWERPKPGEREVLWDLPGGRHYYGGGGHQHRAQSSIIHRDIQPLGVDPT
jgi:hypothetical protein